MDKNSDLLISIYKKAKAKRIVLNQTEFAQALGYSRVHLFDKLIKNKHGISEALIEKAGEFLKNANNVSRETNGVPDITQIDDKDIQSRLLRIEANLEVFQIAIAGLKAKKSEDFGQKFSELQTLIEEAVMRRKGRQT